MSGHDGKYCIPSIKRKKTNDNEICTDFDFGTSLEKVYPLLQIIFEYLLYDDLKSADLVDNIWHKYASEEIQKRNKASWITVAKAPRYSRLLIEKSYNFKFDHIGFGLIFYNYKLIKLHNYVCVHNDPVTRMTFTEYIATEILPKDVDFWAFSCSTIYSPKFEKGFIPSFTGLLIPEIFNVNTKRFCIQLNKIDGYFNNFFIKDEHIHCVLLFTVSNCNTMVKKFIKQILNRQSKNSFALGGGIISGGIKLFQKEETRRIFDVNSLFCIAFTQEKDKLAMFDSYSVVIEENFEERLVEFKNSIKLRENSFAIKMCCAAKANKKTETTVFNKIFPKTFVIGCDVDGEIGLDKFNSWDQEKDTPVVKKSKLDPCLTHEYTTIIVMVTWGKPENVQL